MKWKIIFPITFVLFSVILAYIILYVRVNNVTLDDPLGLLNHMPIFYVPMLFLSALFCLFAWRFLVRAAVLHGAGFWGVLLSFKAHDARYAIVSLIVSSLMILLLPRPRCPRLPNADDSDSPPRPALP